jgi:hypothetical protein
MYPFGNTVKFLLWIEAYIIILILIRKVGEERFIEEGIIILTVVGNASRVFSL